MKIVIKSIPEDFIVQEEARLPLRGKGPFGAYLLKKRNWNTVGVLLKLADDLKIPFAHFSYGGKKDRHSLASQYISIRGARVKDIQAEDYSLTFCGFMDRSMGPDLIEANRFAVVVRGLHAKELEAAESEIRGAKGSGYPNYFDDQRFGSFDARQGFLAEKLLKGHLNGALKIYLTGFFEGDTSKAKTKKKFFLENWGEWRTCIAQAETEFEKKAFEFLHKHPKGFLPLLRQIPREKLSIYLGAFQAHIWNEVLRTIMRETVASPLLSYPGAAGEYLFYSYKEAERGTVLEALEIPTLAGKMDVPDGLIAEAYHRVLAENGIKKSLFNNLKLRKPYLRSTLRRAIVKPREVTFNREADELHVGRKKLMVRFMLPRGSYATMFLKRLFSVNP